MVRKVEIENFKSIQKLDFELGRVNVIIGANGSGKSNILEAIAFASCAAENKLDNDYLNLRGIRVTDSGDLMKSGFKKLNKNKDINIKLTSEENFVNAILNYRGSEYIEWFDKTKEQEAEELSKILNYIFKIKPEIDLSPEVSNIFEPLKQNIRNLMLEKEMTESEITLLFGDYFRTLIRNINLVSNEFKNFLIYSPETSSLRNFDDDSAVEPIGTRGEGLFKLLKIISESKTKQFNRIKENLALLEWFGDLNINSNLLSNERKIIIKDKFIDDLNTLDQKAANEGFLYLLFYFTVLVSNHTPKFFAIDNIDSSLNPKICQALAKRINILAKDFGKQIILTTHNPSILDGLNLEDDEQRLFVAYRNDDGHTKLRRIFKPQLSEPVRLSEMFVRGTIGGLPKNF